MSQFALRAFVSVADKAYKSDLAQDAVPIMQDKGMALSSELYSNVLKACGKNERWSDVLEFLKSSSMTCLTNIIATKLLETMANHNRIDDCLEMLDSFKELLKPTARVAAFRALIAAMKFEVVMNVIDRVRKQGKYISIEDYKKIQECFEHDENWRLTIQLLPSVTRDSFG
ncbi:unnamed protein product [Peronospora farinosa]|nr:unnamed protein product [Peronospora farinosa]